MSSGYKKRKKNSSQQTVNSSDPSITQNKTNKNKRKKRHIATKKS
jgi:hypothetical protein